MSWPCARKNSVKVSDVYRLVFVLRNALQRGPPPSGINAAVTATSLPKFRDSMGPVEGQYSAVGIATCYGLDGPGIESRWGRDFPHPSRPALGSTQPPIQ